MPMEQKMLAKPECMVISPSALPIRNLHREAEVIYVMHGVLEMQIGETVVTLEAGGLAYFAPNTIHQLYPERHPSRQAKLRFSTEWVLSPFVASQPMESCRAFLISVTGKALSAAQSTRITSSSESEIFSA